MEQLAIRGGCPHLDLLSPFLSHPIVKSRYKMFYFAGWRSVASMTYDATLSDVGDRGLHKIMFYHTTKEPFGHLRSSYTGSVKVGELARLSKSARSFFKKSMRTCQEVSTSGRDYPARVEVRLCAGTADLSEIIEKMLDTRRHLIYAGTDQIFQYLYFMFFCLYRAAFNLRLQTVPRRPLSMYHATGVASIAYLASVVLSRQLIAPGWTAIDRLVRSSRSAHGDLWFNFDLLKLDGNSLRCLETVGERYLDRIYQNTRIQIASMDTNVTTYPVNLSEFGHFLASLGLDTAAAGPLRLEHVIPHGQAHQASDEERVIAENLPPVFEDYATRIKRSEFTPVDSIGENDFFLGVIRKWRQVGLCDDFTKTLLDSYFQEIWAEIPQDAVPALTVVIEGRHLTLVPDSKLFEKPGTLFRNVFPDGKYVQIRRDLSSQMLKFCFLRPGLLIDDFFRSTAFADFNHIQTRTAYIVIMKSYMQETGRLQDALNYHMSLGNYINQNFYALPNLARTRIWDCVRGISSSPLRPIVFRLNNQ
ncbi:hypothetical protein BC940DRAFT_324147 [Gongronella butleri]|nr:hypothetical protein BC940DRAFT_324147 [Gongronella butleri]